jgi:hypothetical protein
MDPKNTQEVKAARPACFGFVLEWPWDAERPESELTGPPEKGVQTRENTPRGPDATSPGSVSDPRNSARTCIHTHEWMNDCPPRPIRSRGLYVKHCVCPQPRVMLMPLGPRVKSALTLPKRLHRLNTPYQLMLVPRELCATITKPSGPWKGAIVALFQGPLLPFNTPPEGVDQSTPRAQTRPTMVSSIPGDHPDSVTSSARPEEAGNWA